MDNNEWALDSLGDVLEQDPLRILDVENDTQILLNKIGAPSETERATSNFESLVFGDSRPEDDTFTEFAGRAIPFILTAGAGPLIKGGKALTKLAKSKAATKTFQKAAKKQLYNITNDKYIIDEIANSLEYLDKPSEKPLAIKREVEQVLKKNIRDTKLAEEFADPYINPVAKYISDKAFVLGNAGATPDEIRSILLNEANTLSETSGMDLKNVNRIINDRVNAKQNYQNLKNSREQASYILNEDMKRHPNVYKEFMEENNIDPNNRSIKDIEKLNKFHQNRYEERLQELNRINRSTIPSIPEGVPHNEWNNIIMELAKPSIVATAAVKGPQATIDFGQKMLLNKEPEYKWYNAVSDTLKDMVGLDLGSPSRFNEEEINQYLEWAQDVGLLTSDQWKNWEPRQKLAKVAELAEFAKQYNNTGNEYDYKTIYGATRKEILGR